MEDNPEFQFKGQQPNRLLPVWIWIIILCMPVLYLLKIDWLLTLFILITFIGIIVVILQFVLRKTRMEEKGNNAKIINNTLLIYGKTHVGLEDLNLDIYQTENGFKTFHLWDNMGKLSVFSVNGKDDLMRWLENNRLIKINHRKEIEYDLIDSVATFKCSDNSNTIINLNNGKFLRKELKNTKIKVKPRNFVKYPEYKQL